MRLSPQKNKGPKLRRGREGVEKPHQTRSEPGRRSGRAGVQALFVVTTMGKTGHGWESGATWNVVHQASERAERASFDRLGGGGTR